MNHFVTPNTKLICQQFSLNTFEQQKDGNKITSQMYTICLPAVGKFSLLMDFYLLAKSQKTAGKKGKVSYKSREERRQCPDWKQDM